MTFSRYRPIPEELISDILVRYEAGCGAQTISTAVSVSKSSVLRYLRLAGIVRSLAESVRNPDVRHDAFARLSPEEAYWIGFLMADGNVCRGTLTLCLAGRDHDHVERFRAFVGSKNPVKRIARAGGFEGCTASQFTLRSPQMLADLAALGIVPRKSECAEAPAVLVDDRDFWRGVIDGDGSITVGGSSKLPKISLVGTERITQQFVEFMRRHSIAMVDARREIRNTWSAGAAGTKAILALRLLYGNDGVALPRKKEKAMRFLAEAD